jgi:hypothetical protein
MSAGATGVVTGERFPVSGPLSRLLSLLVPGRLIWVVVLIGGLLRFYRFDALSLWVDEGMSVLFQRLSWDVVLGFHGAYDTHPPLYYALAKAAMWVAPEVTAGRLVSVATGTLTLPVLYAPGAQVDREVGSVAGYSGAGAGTTAHLVLARGAALRAGHAGGMHLLPGTGGILPVA